MSSKKGIENAKRRNAQKVTLTCRTCGETKEITFGAYRNLKDKNSWRCKKCSQKLWYSEMTDKEREEWLSKRNKTLNSLSKEEKERRHQNNINRWKNKSDEEKKKHAEISSRTMKNYWNNLSEEEKARRAEVSFNILENWRKTLNEEDKLKLYEKMSISQKERWANISEEEMEAKRKFTSEFMKEWWKNAPEEVLMERSKKLSEKASYWWNNLTPEKYEEWNNARIEARKNNKINITGTETDFMNTLNIDKIRYYFRWHNQSKHPDFDKMFPMNPITKYPNVSPYHEWDFKLDLNEKSILVDIDGSMHDPEKANYTAMYPNGEIINVAEFVAFNDSKRPYQTDGYDAYIVQCYDDKLTDDTPVVKIQTGEKMSFKSFMALIEFMNSNKLDIID